MRTVEFHYFSYVIEETNNADRLKKQYLETLRDYDTIISLGKQDYADSRKSDEELLNYYKTLPEDDAFFAVYDRSEDDYIGTCRFMRPVNKSIELGYMVFINKRRTGYGNAILNEAIRYISKDINDENDIVYNEIRATTFEDNIASCKSFEHTGFVKISSNNGLSTYVRKLT